MQTDGEISLSCLN